MYFVYDAFKAYISHLSPPSLHPHHDSHAPKNEKKKKNGVQHILTLEERRAVHSTFE